MVTSAGEPRCSFRVDARAHPRRVHFEAHGHAWLTFSPLGRLADCGRRLDAAAGFERDRLGSSKYRYGDSNPGFRRERAAS